VVVDGAENSNNEFDYNIYFNGAVEGASGGTHSLDSDPKLVDSASGDLHLAPGSPALGAGEDLGESTLGATDIDGDARSADSVDIGADQR
jgi:hypothetical protein